MCPRNCNRRDAMKTKLSLAVVVVLVALFGAAVVTNTQAQDRPPADTPPTLDRLEAPSGKLPEARAEAVAVQPNRLVYVGPEGSFLLHPGKSHGVFRWAGQHWANSTSYSFEDANYYYYQLVGTNGWFAFGKVASGGTYLVWKGLGTASNIQWQDLPGGWMRATRGPAVGNLD
jgi:hypothetical protein